MKKNILFILDYYYPHIGGIETLFKDIIDRLAKKGYKIQILTTQSNKTLPKYQKLSKNQEIYRVGSNRINFIWQCFFKGLKLASNADIIHSTTFTGVVPASLIAKIKNKKVIITVHEIYGKLWYKFKGIKGFFYILFEKIIFFVGADKYICVSNHTFNTLRISYRIKDKKLTRIYNGIDYNFWNEKNININEVSRIKKSLNIENKLIGIFYGHPGPQKGTIYLTEALPKIINKNPNFHLIMITSPGKHTNIIKQILQKKGIQNNVNIINSGIKKEKLINYIAVSDIVFIPSITEGFGLAAAETSSLNKKLIVSYAGALPEVVSGKVVFIKPSSSDEIVNAVEKINNYKQKNIPSKTFDIEQTLQKIQELYTYI